MKLLFFFLAAFSCNASMEFLLSDARGARTSTTIFGTSTNVVTICYNVLYMEDGASGHIVFEYGPNAATTANTFFIDWDGNVANKETYFIGGPSANYHCKYWNSTQTTNVWYSRTVVFDRRTSTNNIVVYNAGLSVPLTQLSTYGNGGGTNNFATSQYLHVGVRASALYRLSGLVSDVAIFFGEVNSEEALSIGAFGMSPLKVRSAKLVYFWPGTFGINSYGIPDIVDGTSLGPSTAGNPPAIVMEQKSISRR